MRTWVGRIVARNHARLVARWPKVCPVCGAPAGTQCIPPIGVYRNPYMRGTWLMGFTHIERDG